MTDDYTRRLDRIERLLEQILDALRTSPELTVYGGIMVPCSPMPSEGTTTTDFVVPVIDTEAP